MCTEISLLDLFADSEICDCYMLHAGYCYPVTDISTVKFIEYPSIDIAASQTSDLAVEVICDDQIYYLLHIRPMLESIPDQIMRRPHKMKSLRL